MKSLVPRISAAAAAALIALTGLFSPTTPASAGPPVVAGQTAVSGAATCNPDKQEWLVTWTLTNTASEIATISALKTGVAPIPALVEDATIPRRAANGKDGQRLVHQTLPSGTPSATVSFIAKWKGGGDADNTATVTLGDCKPAETPCVEPADAKFHHEFAVTGGQATATVSVDEGVKLCKAEPVTLVTYYAPKPQFSVPQYEFAHQSATLSNDIRSATLTAALPDCNAQVDLFFGAEKDIIAEITENGPRYGDKKLGSDKGLGARSTGKPGWYNGGAKGCHTPAVKPLSQCDGTVVLHLSNDGKLSKYAVDFTVKAGTFTKTVAVAPGKGETVTVPTGAGPITVQADGMADVTYTWTRPADCPAPTVVVEGDCKTVTVVVTNPKDVLPAQATVAYGTETQQLTVAPGASAKATFGRGTATQATVTIDGLAPITVAVNNPADCAPGQPSEPAKPGDDQGTGGGTGDKDDEGGLPNTGTIAGTVAGGALALLVAGGVLYLVARRRRITFTP
ncbi:transmembrane domain-containing protein [Actinoplanes sp. NPDC051859]|uniref:transmembrane domain-containing protein n=1 Tax=Actinoplanes sp. NPDC051859 TaxID=3363909 RepID=UPI0037B0B799